MSSTDPDNEPTSPPGFAENTVRAVERQLGALRTKLLDLTNRNRLLNFKHSDRSKTQLRIVDAALDDVYQQLDSKKELELRSLPAPPDEPADECSTKFLDALDTARLNDETYRREIESLSDKDDADPAVVRRLERALRDRVREKLGLPKRTTGAVLGVEEHARANGIDPALELKLTGTRRGEKHAREALTLQALLMPEPTERKCRGLLDGYRTYLAETGVNTLYAAVGFVEWYDASDDRTFLAPLVLVPLTMTRKPGPGGKYRYTILRTDAGVESNAALLERAARDFRLKLPAFEPDDQTLEQYFAAVEKSISALPHWRVRRFLTLSLFSFERVVMWRDLSPEAWGQAGQLAKQGLLTTLFAGRREGEPVYAAEYDVDDPHVAAQVPLLITDADSSQFSAIADVMAGKSLAIKGPPGTGKSQTIANMIGAALALGKSVVFMAEKMAALDVVQKRLAETGLGPFLLELHDPRRVSKKDLLRSLDERLSMRPLPPPPRLDERLGELADTRHGLTAYAVALNRQFGSIGVSVQQIFWSAHRHRDATLDLPPSVDEVLLPRPEEITESKCNQWRDLLRDLDAGYRGIVAEGPDITRHPWFGVRRPDLGPHDCRALVLAAEVWAGTLDRLSAEIAGARKTLGVNFGSGLHDLDVLQQATLRIPAGLEGAPAALVGRLATRDALAVVREFVNQLAVHAQLRERLNGRIDVDDARPPPVGALNEMGTRAHRLGVAGLTSAALPREAARLRTEARSLREALTVVSKPWSNLRLEGLPTRSGISALLLAFDVLRRAERRALLARSASVLDERSLPVLSEARETAAKLRAGRRQLGELYDLSALTTTEELRADAAALRGAGMFWFFSPAVWSARSRYKRLAKSAEVQPLDGMGAALAMLADQIDDEEAFKANARIASICGSQYAGIDTDFDALEAAAKWGQVARSQLAGFDGLRSSLRRILLEGDVDTLDAMCKLVEHPRWDSVRKLSGSDDPRPLEECARELEKRANDIEALLQSVNDVGLRSTVSLQSLSELATSVEAVAQVRRQLAESTTAARLLGAAFKGADSDRQPLVAATVWVQRVLDAGLPAELRGLLLSDRPVEATAAIRGFGQRLTSLVSEERAGFDRVTELGQIDTRSHFGCDRTRLTVDGARARLGVALAKRDALPAYASFIRARTKIAATPLEALAARLEGSKGGLMNAPRAFERVLWHSLARRACELEPSLLRFSGVRQEELQKRFRALDREVMKLAREKLVSDLSARHVAGGTGTRAEPRTLTDRALIHHECSKKMKHIPIRDLLDRAGAAIQQAKPCFLMSPLSVAQFLKPGGMTFDLLIIDEASQVRPEEALGAVARARQIVVVGDPNQLPPTAFFDRSDLSDQDDDDDADPLDLESILDLALSGFRPARELRWHYRSKHESLIAYSNAEFYNGNMIVFPSAEPSRPDRGVRYVHVDGQYASRSNQKEASAVVAAARDFMHKELTRRETAPRSLGIVALNQIQRDLIFDELERAVATDVRCQEYTGRFEGTLEPWFVKNLENVQGDERDVIFISTVFGPDAKGVVQQRFGPINGAAGHRRLNVLFTRAKEQVLVFSSMRAEDLRVDGRSSWGLRALKGFLSFAAMGRVDPGKTTGRSYDSDFEAWVAERLARHGYEAVPQVGVAGYFLDLGIRHADFPHGYLCGIECDGAAYHSARSARDRDRLRQEVLEGQGWKLLRIWSTDWFQDPDRELKRIVGRLDELRRLGPRRPSTMGFGAPSTTS